MRGPDIGVGRCAIGEGAEGWRERTGVCVRGCSLREVDGVVVVEVVVSWRRRGGCQVLYGIA
jgi:hypothetical protein